MSQHVQYIGVSPNVLNWDLKGLSDYNFEEIIYGILASDYSFKRDSIKVSQTRKSADGGKDIIIRSKIDFTLFGLPITKEGKDEITVYLECKSTTKSRVRLDSFGKNYLQTRKENIDYFVLITNGTISPNSFHLTYNAFRDNEIAFLVIDEYILKKYIRENNISVFSVDDIDVQHDDLVVEYQSTKYEVGQTLYVDLHLWIRNYSNSVKPCRIYLQTDRNWILSVPEKTFFIEPLRSQSVKIKATQEYQNGLQELKIGFSLNDVYKELLISAQSYTFDFLPRLFGDQHYQIIQEIKEKLDQEYSLCMISITGEAGIGKSRIIDEVIEQRGSSNIKYIRCYFERDNIEKSLLNFLKDIDLTFNTNFLNNEKKKVSPKVVKKVIEKLDSEYFTYVLIFEDLHHADSKICKVFKEIFDIKRELKSPLYLILTGRNDFTFPNEHYYSLLDYIKFYESNNSIFSYEVFPLSDTASKDLIRSTIENIPEIALNKIHKIGMNIPFNILQCIEYLLEMNLVKIKNRNTVGIPNLQQFSSKEYIPDSIEEIFLFRFKSIEKLKYSDSIKTFLFLSTFFGFQIPIELKEVVFDCLPQDILDEVLIGRRFIKIVSDKKIQWHHENILQFFMKLLYEGKKEFYCAEYILNHPALFYSLSNLDKGKIACMSRNYRTSKFYFKEIIAEVKRIDNFSSENINAYYFSYLDYVFKTLNELKSTKDILLKILLAKAYMGVHNLPLLKGAIICRNAREELQKIRLRKDDLEVYTNNLKQLEAHAHMNIGWMNHAKKAMLEIECRIQLSDILKNKNDLKFDLYNRLQDLYRFYNHLKLAEDYGKLAEITAIKADNNKMIAVHLIGTAVLYSYIKPLESLKLSKEAVKFSKSYGTERHVCLARLGLYAAELPYIKNDIEKLEEMSKEVVDLLKIAIEKNYSSALPRIYLLLSVLNFYIEIQKSKIFQKSNRYTDMGIEASVKYGAGHYVWQLYNMKAIIYSHEGKSTNDIFKQFKTAVDYLYSEDLLFLGNLDFCCANLIVISNYIIFLDRYDTEEKLYKFISKLRFYKENEMKTIDDYIKIVKNIRKNKVIFQKKISKSLLYDETSGYSLSVF